MKEALRRLAFALPAAAPIAVPVFRGGIAG